MNGLSPTSQAARLNRKSAAEDSTDSPKRLKAESVESGVYAAKEEAASAQSLGSSG